MSIEVWLSFVAVVLALLSTPGISHILMLSNSLAYGFKNALNTAAGDLSANTLQMMAAGLGIAALIAKAPKAFTAIKWLGVCYLIYLGIKLIFSPPKLDAKTAASAKQLYMQGFVTSSTNPKAIVFFAALFPQFISQTSELAPQLAILTVTYLVLDGCFLIAYGLGANWLSKSVKNQGWIYKASGAFIILAGILLALKTATD